MADSSQFRFYVSSVEGRLTSRPGSPHSYIGARTRTPDEIKAGQTGPVWSPEVVVPVLETEYLQFVREWDKLLKNGDLKLRTAEDFTAYQKSLEAVEAAHVAELAKAEKDAADAKAKAEADAKKQAAKAEKQGGA